MSAIARCRSYAETGNTAAHPDSRSSSKVLESSSSSGSTITQTLPRRAACTTDPELAPTSNSERRYISSKPNDMGTRSGMRHTRFGRIVMSRRPCTQHIRRTLRTSRVLPVRSVSPAFEPSSHRAIPASCRRPARVGTVARAVVWGCALSVSFVAPRLRSYEETGVCSRNGYRILGVRSRQI